MGYVYISSIYIQETGCTSVKALECVCVCKHMCSATHTRKTQQPHRAVAGSTKAAVSPLFAPLLLHLTAGCICIHYTYMRICVEDIKGGKRVEAMCLCVCVCVRARARVLRVCVCKSNMYMYNM